MPRTGRPKSDCPKAVKYSVRMDDETDSKLKRYCEATGANRGEAIRRGIDLLTRDEPQTM